MTTPAQAFANIDMPRKKMVMTGFRNSGEAEGPNESGTYTAGIDAVISDIHGLPDWHLHAMEFHAKNKAEAERWRDFVFDAITKGGLMP